MMIDAPTGAPNDTPSVSPNHYASSGLPDSAVGVASQAKNTIPRPFSADELRLIQAFIAELGAA